MYSYMPEEKRWVYGYPEARSGAMGGRGLRRLVDFAVDAPQEEFGQAGGSYIAGNVWLSINHVLEGSN